MNLVSFIRSPLRNHWVHEKALHLDCYMRKSLRALVRQRDSLEPCIDIASVQVDEDQRRKGSFTKFLDKVEEIARYEQRAVYVENLQHPWLVEFLKARGYQETPTSVPELPTLWWRPFPVSAVNRKGGEPLQENPP